MKGTADPEMRPDRAPASGETPPSSTSVEEALTRLAGYAEEALPGVRCSILLLDESRRHLALMTAPSLPQGLADQLDGLPVGPEAGACGSAAHVGAPVVIEDLGTDPRGALLRDQALAAGLRAAWSEPIVEHGEVVGALALYSSEARGPRPHELDYLRTLARMVSITCATIEHIEGREQQLSEGEKTFRQLAENVGTVFWLTDWRDRRVLYVSPNWEQVWGLPVDCLYSEDTQAWAESIHPDDRERVVASFAAQAVTGAYEEDFRIVQPDGEVRWLHERAFPIHDEEGEVYRVAGIAIDVTRRKQDERALARARDEIEELRRRQVESLTSELLLAEENERRRLARELHDGMNQLITLALLKLAQLRDLTDGPARELAEEIEAVVDQAGQSTRSLTYQLSPPILHDLGFEPALQWLVEDVQQNHGLDVELDEGDETSPLDERVRILLFRAVRELLLNVATHSGAGTAFVRLRHGPEELEISVEDDGDAFDPAELGRRGIGLFSIRERLNHLGGVMRIESRSGGGTRITLIAPIQIPSPPEAT